MSLSGYPVRTPVIDLVEIGAGGGSIAWVDSGGVLRVGPQSAGADPGPVCYGRGGTEPTVTDANLVLGRLNPRYFLGGEIELDVDGAAARDRGALRRAARALRSSRPRTASSRSRTPRWSARCASISVQRGYDPRDFVLVGFGGAGPVHANALARDAEMPTLLIPPSPGIFSATGLLTTDLKRDAAMTIMRRLDELDADEAEATFAELEAAGRDELRARGRRRRRDRVPAPGRPALRRPELRADDPRRRRAPRALPRGARPDVRLRRAGRAGRGRQPAADERRADREAAAAAARARRRGGAEGAPPGLLRRGGRLRRLPDLRPLRPSRRSRVPGPGRRRGVRLDDRRPSRLRASRSTTRAT